MNMQNLMKQAQAMQKEITNIKNEIDNSTFEGSSSLVKVMVNGKKEVLSVKISSDVSDLGDDISMLEDMIILAMNDAFLKVDKTTAEKMGKYSNMMSGLM